MTLTEPGRVGETWETHAEALKVQTQGSGQPGRTADDPEDSRSCELRITP